MSKIDGLYTVKDLRESVVDLYSGNTSQPLNVGYKELQELYKVSRGTFHVWTGVPNHGKSSFLADIIMQMANIHDWKFCLFSPEHSMANNIKRLCEKYMQKPFDYGMQDRITKEELGKALAFINEHFFFIDKANESPDIKWLLNVARQAKDLYNIDGLVIDPYNEINPVRQGNLREDEHISNVISDIKRFNRETQCVTWLVVIQRIFDQEKTLFQVRKVREADLYGSIGEAEFRWNNKTRSFDPLQWSNKDE